MFPGASLPSHALWEGDGSIEVLNFPNLSINVLLQKDVLGAPVLHLPV